MIFLLAISFGIGIVISFIGNYLALDTLTNLGLSWISGTIISIFCNFAISMYYRKKDEQIAKHNQQITQKKNELVEQYNALEELIAVYLDIINSINTYFISNANIQDDVIGLGYYELCKSSSKSPSAVLTAESILNENEIKDIHKAQKRLLQIQRHIETKSFSAIKFQDECLFALGFASRGMVTSCKIKAQLDELNNCIKFN